MHDEIHGKISSSGSNLSDRLEDKLTSDFFGALKYLPPEIGILSLLRNANPFFECNQISLVHSTEFMFWSRSKRGEIDLVVTLRDANERVVSVVGIEVKYLSGISSDEEEPTSIRDTELEPRHQLHRYMKFLGEKYPSSEKWLLYLTRDSADAMSQIGKASRLDGGVSNVFGISLSWSRVYRALAIENAKKHSFPSGAIVRDLMRFLECKNLNSFRPLKDEKRSFQQYLFSTKGCGFSLRQDTTTSIKYEFSSARKRYMLENRDRCVSYQFQTRG